LHFSILALIATATQLIDAKVAFTLADATLQDRLNKVLKGALRELRAPRRYSNKVRLALKPYKRRLALKVRCNAVYLL
jgi:hypothetical protein